MFFCGFSDCISRQTYILKDYAQGFSALNCMQDIKDFGGWRGDLSVYDGGRFDGLRCGVAGCCERYIMPEVPLRWTTTIANRSVQRVRSWVW